MPFGFYENSSRDRFFDIIVPLLPNDIQNEIKVIQNDSSINSSSQWAKISELLQKSYNMMNKNDKEELFEKIREALNNHKAFFFDKTRDVLSIPINGDVESLNENSKSKMFAPDYNRWNGFYVFDLDKIGGFNLKGTITHSADDSYYYGMGNTRTFYIDDVLYTASDKYLKMNFFNNLEEINSIKLENLSSILKKIFHVKSH